MGNENGIYWGLKILPASGLTITTYLDLFSFPWLKYRVDKPSSGRDFMISGTYQVNRKLNVRLQYRLISKEMNYNMEESPQVLILPKTTQRILMNINYALNDVFSIQTRIQHSGVDFNSKKTNGFILAQDINASKRKYSPSGSFAFFDTDNDDNRQFIYEQDLLYLYSIPSFYNKGVRYFLLAKYKFSRRVEFWIKMSQTKYLDLKSIGSGLETINGDKKNQFQRPDSH